MSRKRDIAVDFLQLIVGGKVDKAYTEYISEDFIHHNPYFRGDAKSLKAAMKENGGKSPNKSFEVKQTIEEENKVMVFSHIKQNADDRGAAVIHIFRFYEGKIVEMWDIGQPIPEDSPNENGMF